MKKPLLTLTVALLAFLPLQAMVNPSLQPYHLVDRYSTVLAGEVTKADDGEVVIKVTELFKGNFEPKEISIEVPAKEAPEGEDGDAAQNISDALETGNPVIAYVGATRRRGENNVLVYAGSYFHQAEIIDTAAPAKWRWQENLGDRMWGTFNGDPHMLIAMMKDAKEGRVFFPALPIERFKPDIIVDKLDASIRGVALYDVDGDGRLDIYACSDKGNRLYLQTAPVKFENKTAELGLDKITSVSCSFADVNADGKADLLVGARIYLAGEKTFASADLLPAHEGELKSSAFADVNGDGFPDVIISTVGKGLALYLNPGKAGGKFTDATETAGLKQTASAGAGSGFFTVGDWNGDNKIDLFYSVGKGMLLTQDAQGKFTPVTHSLDFRFDEKTGAGSFAPIWTAGSTDLVVPMAESVTIATRRDEKVANVTQYGNELNETHADQLAALCEDFNMDGRVDIYVLTSSESTPLRFITNRGYGSFMNPENYSKEGFPGEAHQKGAWGGAAADVSGDGAIDVLLGSLDGTLSLMINDTLSLRQPQENPDVQTKVLSGTKIVSARIKGSVGVLNSEVRIQDEKNQTVARRLIGSDIITGCRGPDSVDLAIRIPGKYTLSVRYSDGHTQTWPVDLTGEAQRIEVTAVRESK